MQHKDYNIYKGKIFDNMAQNPGEEEAEGSFQMILIVCVHWHTITWGYFEKLKCLL